MENLMPIDGRAARTGVLESRLYRVQNPRGAPPRNAALRKAMSILAEDRRPTAHRNTFQRNAALGVPERHSTR